MQELKAMAEKLNGLQYRERPEKTIIDEAKKAGIVIVYGASDDLMEFDGAVYDEVGCYEGGTVYFNSEGLITNKCDSDDCHYFLEEQKKGIPIEALWCQGDNYSWTYKTEIPHETFDVLEDGELYCKGIVFNLNRLTGV